MGVSPQSARLAACVGTNLNNDGILLYEAMAVLFVAQYYGIPLDFGRQLLAAASCVVAGIGIAGVPEAGLISLALVLTTVGLPTEILPLLLTVDWLLSALPRGHECDQRYPGGRLARPVWRPGRTTRRTRAGG